MSTINVANHTSVINSYVPPKFNHHYTLQATMFSKSSHHVPLFYEIFRHVCEKLTTDFYKSEKSGEKKKST